MNSEELDEATLELYVLGALPKEEARSVEALATRDAAIAGRVKELRGAIDGIALSGRITPPAGLCGKVLAALQKAVEDERASGKPPMLHANSTIADFEPWVARPGYELPVGTTEFHLVELEETEARQTGLVWLKSEYPEEVHTDCVERLLILDGTCDVHIGDAVTSHRAGDVIVIPMHVPHHVRVTGEGWCKAIVQRVAA